MKDLLERLRRGRKRLAAAGRQYGESQATVAARAAWLRLAYGVNLERSIDSGMLDPRILPPRRDINPGGRAFRKILARFNPSRDELVDDKILFAARAAGYGLPVPRVFASTTPRLGVTADGRALADAAAWRRFLLEELPDQFLVKPAESWAGRGVEVFAREAGVFKSSGKTFTPEELHRRLVVDAAYGRAVIQERLRNHPALAEFSPAPGLQTVRMVTVVTRTGTVEIVYAYLKIIVGPYLIDNYGDGTMGNLVAQADHATGVLGLALGPGAELIGIPEVTAHPGTGRPIAGFRLPDWDATVALARAAALRFLPMRALAWDIALTPDGPKLLEANTNWSPYCGPGFWFEPEQVAWLMERL